MRLGARIIKTGITLILALYLSQSLDMGPTILTAIAATLAIQPSVYRSWQYGIEQVQSNLVGATIAIIFLSYIGTNPFFIAIAIMLVIAINLQLKFDRSIPLSMVTVLSIMDGGLQATNYFLYAFDRFILIFLGVFSAILVNALLYPPRYEFQLIKKLKNSAEQIASILRIILDSEKNERYIRAKIDDLEKEIEGMWNLLHFELEESKRFFKRKRPFHSARKIVVFKAMLNTSKLSIEMFHFIEKYQNTIDQLPKEIFVKFQSLLIDLANYQDRIYSKFDGRINSSAHHNTNEILIQATVDLYNQLNKLTLDQPKTFDILAVISSIREFHKKLDHLEKLIDSFHSHHQGEKITN